MGNKTGSANKADVGGPVQIGKALPQVKMMLNKLENIYPDNNLHFLFLDDDFDPIYANSPWSDLEVGQRVVNSIFAKLRLTAKLFAQTLNESETRCIHMKGDSNIFSYYAIKDFHLVIHRTLPPPPPPQIITLPSPPPMPVPSIVKPNTTKSPNHSTGSNLSVAGTSNRDRSPSSKSGHRQQPSTTFVKHSSTSSSSADPPSPRMQVKSSRDRSGTVSSPSGLYRDDEEKSKQVEAILFVIEELIYGSSKPVHS